MGQINWDGVEDLCFPETPVARAHTAGRYIGRWSSLGTVEQLYWVGADSARVVQEPVNRLRTSEADLEGAVPGNLAPPVAGRSLLVSQKLRV